MGLVKYYNLPRINVYIKQGSPTSILGSAEVTALVFAACCGLRVVLAALYFTELSRKLHKQHGGSPAIPLDFVGLV